MCPKSHSFIFILKYKYIFIFYIYNVKVVTFILCPALMIASLKTLFK